MTKTPPKNAAAAQSLATRTAVPGRHGTSDDAPDTNECAVTGRLVSCDPPTHDGQPVRMRIAIRQADGHREIVDCEVSRPAAIRTILAAAEGTRLSLVGSVRKRFWRTPGAGLVSRTYLEVQRVAKIR